MRRLLEIKAKRYLKKDNELWRQLTDYLHKSSSTGCNYSDYAALYKHVLEHKPKEILECGTGVSTIIMAQALKKVGGRGRITSLESIEKYFELAQSLLPKDLSNYVEIKFSSVIEDSFSLFRGCRYRDIPMDRKYDFIYVDGPSYVAPSDDTVTFDFDFLYIVQHSNHPVYAIIDKRVSSCYVFQKVFGKNKVKYDSFRHLGFAGPCTKNDIKHFSKIPSEAFTDSFSLFGNSVLKLQFPVFFNSEK